MINLKYHDEEFAVCEIEYSFLLNAKEKSKLVFFTQFLKDFNFKAIIIDLSYAEVVDEDVLNSFAQLLNSEKYIKLYHIKTLSMEIIKTFYDKSIDVITPIENISFFDTYNFNNIIYEINLFYEDYLYLRDVISEIETRYKNKNIIVSPKVNNDIDFKAYRMIIDYILKTSNNNISLNSFHLPTEIIKLHPCNVYLCTGHDCHIKKTNYPRYIEIDKNGNLHPYKIKYNQIRIGNLIDDEFDLYLVFSKYTNSIQHRQFLELNREVFKKINYLKFEIVPWRDMIEMEARRRYDKDTSSELYHK